MTDREAGDGRLALAPMQRALWASQRLNPTEPLQNMAHLTHIDGRIDPARFAGAFASVVAASDALRTRIVEVDGVPWVTLDADQPVTEILEIPRDEADPWAHQRINEPLDMGRRGHDSALLLHEDGTASWYLAIHHTITDATSTAMVFEATSRAYAGDPPTFGSYYQWADHIAERHDTRAGRADAHWTARNPPPRVGSLYRHAVAESTRSTRLNADLDDDLAAAAEAALNSDYRMLSQELAWSTVLCTAAAVHLHRVTGCRSLSVGLPVHGRNDPTARAVVGALVELFPVDIEIEPGDDFLTLHRRVARSVMSTLSNAANGTSPRPDYSVVVNVIPKAGFGPFDEAETKTRWIHPGASDPTNLIWLQLSPYTSGAPTLEIDINATAAAPEVATRVVTHVQNILRSMFESPTQRVSEVDLAGTDEIETLDAWRSTEPAGDAPSTLEALRRSLIDSHAPVIEDGNLSLTGNELWRRVEQAASWMAANGAVSGDRVAVAIPRSVDAVVAIFAVMLAGCCYVPLDPAHPRERRDRLASRAGCRMTITELPQPIEHELPAPSMPARVPTDEAYVLFTSGSTGEPKGVPITHRGLDTYIAFALDAYFAGSGVPVAPLFTALTFDLTVTTLFAPLIAGGRLVVVREDGPTGVLRVADRSDLTFLKATPSHLDILVKARPKSVELATIVVGGEAFPGHLATQLWRTFPDAEVFNEYGPTEAVVGCMIHTATAEDVERFSAVPIGRPAPGVTLAVVDDLLSTLPIGAVGELCIASDGLTAGYLDDHAGPDPFVTIGGTRHYRSGDLVRLVDDSTLMYVGRADEQIKIGGIRLEPTEVEHALLEHPEIAGAAVRLRHGILVAWVVKAGGAEPPAPDALTRHLATRLPSHAIPGAFVAVDELPVTTNGKLDDASLPDPDRSDHHGTTAFVAPETDLERAVVAVYEAAIERHVGLDDDFFASGGDSLGAIAMIVALESKIGVPLAESAAFSYTTPRTLVAAIEAGSADRTEDGPTPREPGTPPPLSSGEASLLYEHLLQPDSRRYNLARRYIVEGPTDAGRLERSVRAIVADHEPFRWTFSEPRRELSVSEALSFDEGTGVVSEAEFAAKVDALSGIAYDLDHGPLMRVVHRCLDANRTGIAIMMHHVSGDAGTLDRLWEQLDDRYTSGRAPAIGFRYSDHATWQRSRDNTEAARFWSSDQLALPTATISHDTAGPSRDGYVSRRASFGPDDLRAGPGTTPFVTSLAALAWMLRRRADGDRIGVAFTGSTRDHPGAEPLLGYYLNTLPFVVEVDAADSAAQVVKRCSELIPETIAHRAYPYAQIVADRRAADLPPPSASILFTLEELGPVEFGGYVATPTIVPNHEAVTDLAVFVIVGRDSIELGVEHSGTVIDAEGAAELLDDLDAAILHTLERPTSPPESLALPSIGRPVDGALFATEPDLSVVDVFSDIARRTPDSVGAMCGCVELTYREIDEASNRLANHLRGLGVERGEFIGVEASRNPHTIAAILGVLKTGAAYVPLDPEYPASHRSMVLDDADITHIVSSTRLDAPGESTSVIGLNDESVSSASPDRPAIQLSDTDAAYVIYTSGSTGRPKGVVVSHGNIAHSTYARRLVYPDPPSSFLLLSSFAFDSSMVGLWWSLTTGGRVVLPQEGEQTDVWRLGEIIESESITHVLALPSLYELIVAELKPGNVDHLTTAIVAGEACRPSTIAAHLEAGLTAALYNEFGPTEATVWTHAARVDTLPSGELPPIGSPIPGVKSAVVDQSGRLLPVGTPGELVVAGPTVAAGYHRRAELTAEKFGPIPSLGDGRWYRTGDIVKQRRDGTFMFTGRIDDQVKIRGHRIELGEVAAAASANPGVIEAVAGIAACDEPTTPRLAVWFTTNGDVGCAEVRDTIESRLPGHMVPTLLRELDHFPRTPAGKVDRAALPEPLPVESTRAVGRAPAGEPEVALARVWCDVLGLPEVKADDNFFDLGGDSIVSIQIVSRLRKLGYTSTPRDLFMNQTIGELAATLTQTDAATRPLPLIDPTGPAPLSAIQSWFFNQGFADPSHWNQSIWLDLEPGTDVPRLGAALRAVVERHPILRTTFESADGRIVQQIGAGTEPAPVELHRYLDDVQRNHVRARLDDSLDLSSGRLVAAAAFLEADGGVSFYLTIHHLVIDGVSWGPLLDELSQAYRNPDHHAIRPLGTSASFRAWATACAGLTEAGTGGDHWKATAARIETSTLPPEDENRAGAERSALATLDETQTASWLLRGDGPHALVAATCVGLGEALGRADIGLMLEGHGREAQVAGDIDVTGTIGWFTSMFPIVVENVHRAANAVLGDVAATMNALPDSGVGYGIQREVLEISGVVESPTPDLALNYLGQLDRTIKVSNPIIAAGRLNGSVGRANVRGESIGVLCFVKDERLNIEVLHVDAALSTQGAQLLVNRIAEIIATELSTEDRGTSTVAERDFDLVDLEEPELDHLTELLKSLDA